MAQLMEWNKYPEVMPPADDIYLAVVGFDTGKKMEERSVLPMFFDHDLSTVDSESFGNEHRPGWYDQIDSNRINYFECKVHYWMPFPKPPQE